MPSKLLQDQHCTVSISAGTQVTLRDTHGATQPCLMPTPGWGCGKPPPPAAKEAELGACEEHCCQIWGTLKY